MKCSEAKRRLSEYLDRDLTFEEEERLRTHLGMCKECADEEEQLQCLLGLLHDLPETDPGEGFLAAVQARIAEAEAGQLEVADEPVRESLSVGEWLREALASAWLRPAMGAAFGLGVGLLIGFSGGSDDGGAMTNPGTGMPGMADNVEAVSDRNPADAGVDGPFADLELPDSDDQEGLDEEYLLEPYMLDQEGQLVPRGSIGQRTVQSDRDSQSDVVITF